MSTVKANAIIDASGGNTATINSMTPTADSLQGQRNRIINGAMVIDQRNAGASITPTDGQYSVDRWRCYVSAASKYSAQQNAGAVTPPVGFSNYLGATSLSAYSVTSSDYFFLQQRIEGFNFADLGWGTANAKTVTLSFWVRSSLTGTFGGAFQNSAVDRAYPFSYSISSANTWEQKTITVAGDTSGTWVGSTNGIGVSVAFSLGMGTTRSATANAWTAGNIISATGATSVVGTNGATFYITGVQLEVGSVATPFERRDYGRELAMCQRYYYKQKATNAGSYFGAGLAFSTTRAIIITQFGVQMRTAPTALEQSGTASDYRVLNSSGSGVACSSVPVFGASSNDSASTELTVSSGLTAGNATMGVANTSFNGYLAWSAEL